MESMANEEDLSKKKKVGNYLLGKIVGQGSFAKVRLGLHIIAREKVAVKIVPKKAVLLREYVKRSVRREAMLLQKLDHPNIIRMYEIMETENSYYLVLEYAECGEFIKYLSEKTRLDEKESRKYLLQIASAVDHMHASNITHRDLKLENLLLDRKYNIKIIDFGQSNVFYGDSSLNTPCASPVYAAPEMICNRKYGPAVDIWSMGVCFYAMLTGKLPFTVEPPNNISLLHALILRGAHLPGHISDSCANLLARMLAVDVNNRITLDDLFQHDWLKDGHLPAPRQQPVSKLYHSVPKSQIVHYMTSVFNFLEDDIYDSVIERKMNAVAATYCLLQRRFDAGLQLVGYSVSVKDTQLKQTESAKGTIDTTKLPLVTTDISESVLEGVHEPRANLKSYAQLMKDCKSRSAQNTRSGSLLLRQKEITLRRYKTRADIIKGAKIKEEFGFLPDFVLTYSQNDGMCSISGPSRSQGEDKFEWEQTFVINKNANQGNASDGTEKRLHLRHPTSQSDQVCINYDGRMTRDADSAIPAPPTTPASPNSPSRDPLFNRHLPQTSTNKVPKDISANKTCNGPDLQTSLIIESESKFKATEEHCSEKPISLFNKQKLQLARFTPSVKGGNCQSQSGSRRKLLTSKEARSYFREIDNARVIGQGRTLIERARTSSAAKIEDVNTLYGRKVRTAGSHRQLPDIRLASKSALRSTSGAPTPGHFPSSDLHGHINFSDVTSRPLYDVRPVSSSKHIVEDGVTDVIKVHITSSNKF